MRGARACSAGVTTSAAVVLSARGGGGQQWQWQSHDQVVSWSGGG
ncbi:Uncharacterised protein [Amycolatopsis camponoti]|uniref:Uncharacterized protein n=1 Tax=Amycolatopsis camponoti TaxID=2606593 RepID=A0A6I8LYY1_9PSEU|nr:Uncharacterised protein [Amycolatopsis camponoti]